MVDRAELRKLAEAATPGPWRAAADGTGVVLDNRDCDGFELPTNYYRNGCPKAIADVRYADWRDCFADASYIAAASPDVVLGLLDEIERDRCEISRLNELLACFVPGAQTDAINQLIMEAAASIVAERDQLREEAKQALVIVGNVGRELGQTQHERDQLRAVAVRLKGALENCCDVPTTDAVVSVVDAILSDPEVEKL